MPEKKTPVERRLAPGVPVELEFENGEKFSFRLAFDMNVLARIVEKTGLNLLDTREMWAKLDARILGAMFWAAASVYQPKLDTDEGLVVMRSILNPDNQERVFEALWEAYLLFLPARQREAVKKAREEASQRAENPQTPATTETAPAPAASTPSESSSSSGPSLATTSASATASSAS